MVQVNAANSGSESFEKMLSEKAHNKKWINFARKELRKYRTTGSARHREPEDYAEDVKLKLLTGEIVFTAGNGSADNFICGIIKNEIKTEMRKEPMMVTLREREDLGDEGEEGENGYGGKAEAGVGIGDDENFIVSFEDPFENKVEVMGNWEIMKICYEILEKEEPEMLVVFDERAKGHPNREIAKYLHVEVSVIEKIWKRVVRLLRKNILFNFS
jgi:DNA-directed RNA polymerase specialized sigma24 family protein